MKYNNILETIGNTPHLRLARLFPEHEVWIKTERQNPGGGIKDRIALAMIEDAENKGILKKGSIIVEPTSGNTGIGLSLVAALKGYKVIIVMPESMSIERRKIMQAYGAELVLTPRELGMKGAIDRAEELVNRLENTWMPQQFKNRSNPDIHRKTTAQEILNDFPEGFDYFVSGVGTGGHLTGVGEVLKGEFPSLKVIAVEPEDSPVLSGGKAGAHPLQGIGAGFVPETLNINIIDGVLTVSKDEAFEYAREAAKREGLFVGISTGASLAAINKILTNTSEARRIITFNYDAGERYLSVNGLY